jgi:hypothetical protein
MKIIRDDARILKLARISQALNLAGLTVLMVGLFIALGSTDNSRLVLVQLFTLLVGISIWQVSINFGHKYVRRPRPDQQLDEALKAALPTATMFHYILPADHVYMTRSGPIVLVPKTQTGEFTVSGADGDRWRRKEALWRRFLIQGPPFGNPTRDAEAAVGALVTYIRKNAPELGDVELPISALIVFASSPALLVNPEESRIPVVHIRDLKKQVRRMTGRSLPREQYDRLLEIFSAAQKQGATTVEVSAEEA